MRELPSSEDLDPHPRTDAPTPATPWIAKSHLFIRAWDNIRQKASDAWANIRGFFEGAFSSFKQFFIDTWNGIVTDFSNIWQGIVGIADKIWVMVQDKFKSGINAVIDVINKFAGAINTVASAIGFDLKLHVDPLAEGGPVVGRYEGGTIAYKEVIHRATGGGVSGQLPGYSPGVDTIPAMAGRQPYMLAGGEYIVRPESTRAIGPVGMAAINNAYRTPIGLAEGGATWPAMLGIVQKQFPWALDNSDYRPGDSGYHGKSEALDVGAPGDNPAQLAQVAAWIGSNYSNSTELIHNPNGSIKFGKSVPPSFWGAETWAAHANHVHWANDRDPSLNSGNLLGTISSNVTGAVSNLLGAAARLAITPVKAAVSAVGDRTGYPGGMAAHSMNTVLDKLVSLSDAKDSAGGGAPGGTYTGPIPGGDAVGRWRGLVDSTLTELGMPTSLDDKVLRQIATESSGNPNATQGAIGDVNNASGDLARGLMQVIGTTFHRYAGPYDALGQYDPHASIYAGLNYARATYGPDLSFLGQGHGYDDGGWMKPGDVGANFSTKPEPVFSSAQWEVLRANLNTGQGGGGKVIAGNHFDAGSTVYITNEPETQRLARNEAARLAAAF